MLRSNIAGSRGRMRSCPLASATDRAARRRARDSGEYRNGACREGSDPDYPNCPSHWGGPGRQRPGPELQHAGRQRHRHDHTGCGIGAEAAADAARIVADRRNGCPVRESAQCIAAAEVREIEAAAKVPGVRLLVLNAASPSELDAAFERVAEARHSAVRKPVHDLYRKRRSGPTPRVTPFPC
jgi:hypothetical protein